MITFNAYYFPGWRAEVDGKNTAIQIGNPYGQIEVKVTPGKHTVEFLWLETPLRKVFDYISLGFLVSAFFIFFKSRK